MADVQQMMDTAKIDNTRRDKGAMWYGTGNILKNGLTIAPH
jgi:hypothetical protein